MVPAANAESVVVPVKIPVTPKTKKGEQIRAIKK
jgi:hypothetical protein